MREAATAAAAAAKPHRRKERQKKEELHLQCSTGTKRRAQVTTLILQLLLELFRSTFNATRAKDFFIPSAVESLATELATLKDQNNLIV
jgi:hypothetical protein